MTKIVFLVTMLLSQSLWAGLEVQALNKKLEQKQAGWVAKKTWLSGLSKAEAKRMMGLRREEPSVQFLVPSTFIRASLPTSVDWRNKDGKNWVSPILNQANCGSCVAFASVGVLETQYRISSGLPNFNVKLSPQHLFACGGGGCDFGWMPDSAARYLQRSGVPDEACSPYTSGATGQDVACNASCSDAKARSLKIANFTMPTRYAKNVEAVKQALQKGPVVTTLTVYADFMSYADGVYKHVTGDALGGHAISIIGYDDNLQAFIIRNSWGEDWGQKGFAMVSYDDESGVGEETWLYETPSMSGAISVTSPMDYSYFSGKVSLEAQSTFSATDSLNATVYDRNAKVVWNGTCSGSTCHDLVDVTGLADGRYEIQVTVQDSHGAAVATSSRHLFFVANQKPALNVAFGGHNGLDLGKALQGRIELDVKTTSSSVPMSTLVFHYRGPDGIEHTRQSSVVIPSMTVGWRTNLVPSGAYEIWFSGNVKTNTFDTLVESAHRNVQLQN